MVLTKGCARNLKEKAQLIRHRTGPGISIVSYVHVCRDRDFCNDLSTTETLWTPTPTPEPREPVNPALSKEIVLNVVQEETQCP